jgi:hypothetical protein
MIVRYTLTYAINVYDYWNFEFEYSSWWCVLVCVFNFVTYWLEANEFFCVLSPHNHLFYRMLFSWNCSLSSCTK